MSTFNAALLEGVNARDVTVKDNQLIAIAQLMGNIYLTGLSTPVQLSEEAKALAQNKADTIHLRWGQHFPEKNPEFVGRKKIYNELEQGFARNSESNFIQVIVGLSGAGKTQLIAKFARDKFELNDYNLVAWLSCSKNDGFFNDFKDLGSRLNVKLQDGESRYNLVKRIKEQLAKIPRVLLLFDNLSCCEDIKPYILQSDELNTRHCYHVLGTSLNSLIARNQRGFPILVTELDFLGLDEASQFIRRCLHDNSAFSQLSSTEQIQQANALATILDKYTLALAQAVAYIRATENMTVKKYLKKYEKNHKMLLRQHKISDDVYKAAVSKTLRKSVKAIKKKQPIAAALLRLCVFLDAEHIPYFLVKKLLAQITSNELEKSLDIDFEGEILSLWRAYSLINVSEDGSFLKMHRLVRIIIQDKLNRIQTQYYCKEVLKTLNSLLCEDIYSVETLLVNRELISHGVCVLNHINTKTLIEADRKLVLEAGQKIAMTYLELHECHEAIKLFLLLIKLSNCKDIKTQLSTMAARLMTNIIDVNFKNEKHYRHKYYSELMEGKSKRYKVKRSTLRSVQANIVTLLDTIHIQAPCNAELSFLFEKLALSYLYLHQKNTKQEYQEIAREIISERYNLRKDYYENEAELNFDKTAQSNILKDLAKSLILLRTAYIINHKLSKFKGSRIVVNLCEFSLLAKTMYKVEKNVLEFPTADDTTKKDLITACLNFNIILSSLNRMGNDMTCEYNSFHQISKRLARLAFDQKSRVLKIENPRETCSGLLDTAKKMLRRTKVKGNHTLLTVLLLISRSGIAKEDIELRVELLELTLKAAEQCYTANSVRVAEVKVYLAQSLITSKRIYKPRKILALCTEALSVIYSTNTKHFLLFKCMHIIMKVLLEEHSNKTRLVDMKKVVDIITAQLKNSNSVLQYTAAVVLALYKPPKNLVSNIPSILTNALTDMFSNLDLILGAIYGLKSLNVTSDEVIKALSIHLGNTDQSVRKGAYDTLKDLKSLNHRIVINTCLENLNSNDDGWFNSIQELAIRILGNHGKAHRQHIASILKTRFSDKSMYRVWLPSVEMLYKMGCTSKELKVFISNLLNLADADDKSKQENIQQFLYQLSSRLKSYGNDLFSQEKLAEAISYYRYSIKYYPKSKAYLKLARCYLIQCKTNLAREYFEKGLELNPTQELYLEYSHFLCRTQQWTEALVILSKNSSFSEYSELTYCLQELSIVMPCLQEIVEQNSKFAISHKLFSLYLLAYCYHHLKQTEQLTATVISLEEYDSWYLEEKDLKEKLINDVKRFMVTDKKVLTEEKLNEPQKEINIDNSQEQLHLEKEIERKLAKESNQENYTKLVNTTTESTNILPESVQSQTSIYDHTYNEIDSNQIGDLNY